MKDGKSLADRDEQLAGALSRLATQVVHLSLDTWDGIGDQAPTIEVTKSVLKDFRYDDEGVYSSGGTHSQETRPYWRPLIRAVAEQVEADSPFKEAKEFMAGQAGASADAEGFAKSRLRSFVAAVAERALEDPTRAELVAGEAVETALTELAGRPVPYRALVEIGGLVLYRCDFRFDVDGCRYRLRQSQREDKGKQHLTTLVDDALIDPARDEELARFVTAARPLCVPRPTE